MIYTVYPAVQDCKAKNSSLNEQIRILEEYKEQEFTEKWSYELAALYYKAGEKAEMSGFMQ